MSVSSTATPQLQSSGMLSREQFLHLFNRFTYLASQPDVKKRIADDVKDKHEAVAVTTAIQEEIFLEMGVDPRFGLSCLGKVNMAYENDQDFMIHFYKFIAREEMACDEAELGPDEFTERMHSQQILQEQQLEMLKHMRKFPLDDQSAILEKGFSLSLSLNWVLCFDSCTSRWTMPIMRVGHRFCHQNRFRRLFRGGYPLYLALSGHDMVNGSRKCAEGTLDNAPREVGGRSLS